MNLASPSHPVWPLAKLTILMTSLTTILYITSSKFDSTEIKTILTMFLVSSGIEGASAIVSKLKGA